MPAVVDAILGSRTVHKNERVSMTVSRPCSTPMGGGSCLHNGLGLLLLKPDGFCNSEVQRTVEQQLRVFRLKVVDRRVFQLEGEQVAEIWPVFATGEHPMNRRLYELYMSSGPCEAVLVVGEDAIKKCLQVKKGIRKAFEICAFENAIHSPADGEELASNLSALFGTLPTKPDTKWPEWSKRGRFGTAAQIPRAEVNRIADGIWGDKTRGGWKAVYRPRNNSRRSTWRAVLRPGDPNSIDFGMSVIFNELRGPDFDWVARAYIEAEVSGGACIASGSWPEIENIQRRFRSYNMTIDLCEV